jgi:concanavalin A-like lectin/glucanase superfamily protein
MRLLSCIVVVVLMSSVGNLWAKGGAPFFSCSFEDRAEINDLGGDCSSAVKFSPGLKGQAANARKGTSCKFPASKCLPKTEGSLSIWIYPYWKLDKEAKHKGRMISCVNEEQEIPEDAGLHHYNYFCLLGYAYGNPSKGDPCNLVTLVRKGPGKESTLVFRDDVSWEKEKWQHLVVVWRINTNKLDGVFKLYLNGERIERKTDFRAYRIKLGKYLQINLDAKLDELKIWDRILNDVEVKEEFHNRGGK